MKKLLLFLTIALCMSACQLVDNTDYIRVIKDKTPVHSKADSESPIIFNLNRGEMLRALPINNNYRYEAYTKGWYEIKSKQSNDVTGWAKKPYIEYVDGEAFRKQNINSKGKDILKISFFANWPLISQIREIEIPRYIMPLVILALTFVLFCLSHKERKILVYTDINVSVVTRELKFRRIVFFFLVLLQSLSVLFYVLHEPSLFWFTSNVEAYSSWLLFAGLVSLVFCSVAQVFIYKYLFGQCVEDDYDNAIGYYIFGLFWILAALATSVLFLDNILEHMPLVCYIFIGSQVLGVLLFLIFKTKARLNIVQKIFVILIFFLLSLVSTLIILPVLAYTIWFVFVVLVAVVLLLLYYLWTAVIPYILNGMTSSQYDDSRTITLEDGTRILEEKDLFGGTGRYVDRDGIDTYKKADNANNEYFKD